MPSLELEMPKHLQFLLVSMILLNGCMPFGRYTPRELGPVELLPPEEEYRKLKAFIERRGGWIDDSGKSIEYLYDQLAKSFRIGNTIIRVNPHNYGDDSFLIEVVHIPNADNDTLAAFLRHDKSVKYPYPLCTAPDREKSVVAVRGIALGTPLDEAVLRHQNAIAGTVDDARYIELARPPASHMEFPEGALNLKADPANGRIKALRWHTNPAPLDDMTRSRRGAHFEVIRQGVISPAK